MTHTKVEQQTKQLIDDLKATCASYGLGNSGNEYEIITEVFLYKFLNDKFGYEIKQIDNKTYSDRLASAEKWENEVEKFTDEEYEDLLTYLPADSPRLKKEHFVSNLYNQQAKGDFSTLLDATLVDIANYNAAIFSVKTNEETSVTLFEPITTHIKNTGQRDAFARALVGRLVNFNFEEVFSQRYDFFSTIFEYLIKDYNKDGGGTYAEYYTPHAVATIMSQLLVGKDENIQDVTCYDPSAGSGTLLMAIAHAIGEDRCSIYSQDISQKSSTMLRLNLILNNLVHSIPNVIQGDTLESPYHKDSKSRLQTFDYIVSNPPFKLDFSGTQPKLKTESRFFAGVPNIPKNKKNSMSVYLLFLQHIMNSLSAKGRAAIVVPTGFVTATGKIEKKIREKMVGDKILAGVVSMPSNIFATTGTNVSVIFLDKNNTDGKVVLIDASNLGVIVKDEGKNQRTKLEDEDEKLIINIFHQKLPVENLSVVVSHNEIKEKAYSFNAGQYFDIKIECIDITAEEFDIKMNKHKKKLTMMIEESTQLGVDIMKQLGNLKI